MSHRRVVHPRIGHLELWDAETAGEPLFSRREAPDYAARVAEVLARELDARAAAGPPRVLLAGGDPRARDVVTALAQRGVAAALLEDPMFAPLEAAAAILGARDGALVVDAGQTGLKVRFGGRTSRVERACGVNDAEGFLSSLRALLATCVGFDRWLVALPSEIADDTAIGSSYFRALPLATIAALSDAPLSVSTDAELAAWAALPHAGSDCALVATLGHGLGAAWIGPA